MSFDAQTVQMLAVGTLETLYMIFASAVMAYVIGLPLGVILVVTDKDGIRPMPVVNQILGFIINILRSIPFIILLIMILPITRAIAGTTIGVNATVVPLVASAAPYIARMIESALKEVDAGVIEAAKSMGASTWQIIYKVLLPESVPVNLMGAAITVTTILGYTAMTGFTGGGGLGGIAVNYGYYRYETAIMLVSVVLLIVIVQIIQAAGVKLSRKCDKRIR